VCCCSSGRPVASAAVEDAKTNLFSAALGCSNASDRSKLRQAGNYTRVARKTQAISVYYLSQPAVINGKLDFGPLPEENQRVRHSVAVLALTSLLAGVLASGPAAAVVNGSPVENGVFGAEYPWMVVVVHRVNGGICGGVLVSPTWVLTAAHCTGIRKVVLAGSPEREAGKRLEILRAVRHPDFNPDTGENDVGLLMLSEPVDVPVAGLMNAADEAQWLKSGNGAQILGWGRLPSGNLADILMQAELQPDATRVDKSVLSLIAPAGPCHRDSGGPLLMRDSGGGWLLAGIIISTNGNLCKTGGGRSNYARIVSVRPFIEQQVKDLPSGD